MATFNTGRTYTSGDTVTADDQNDQVNQATVTRTSVDDTDNSTLEVSANKYRIKDDGVTAAKINPDVAGSGLVANGGTGALDINPDGVGLELSGDALQLKDDGVTQDKLDKATQAEMEAENATDGVPTPDVLKYHPSAAKAWGLLGYSASDATLYNSYNVASVTDIGNARTVTFTNNMASINYVVVLSMNSPLSLQFNMNIGNKLVSSFDIGGPGETNGLIVGFAVYGELA